MCAVLSSSSLQLSACIMLRLKLSAIKALLTILRLLCMVLITLSSIQHAARTLHSTSTVLYTAQRECACWASALPGTVHTHRAVSCSL
eukprot:2622-Heterococcus_DN1.PRE.1